MRTTVWLDLDPYVATRVRDYSGVMQHACSNGNGTSTSARSALQKPGHFRMAVGSPPNRKYPKNYPSALLARKRSNATKCRFSWWPSGE